MSRTTVSTYTPVLATKPDMVVLQYIDTVITLCRIRGIYHLILRGDYDKAKWVIAEFYISLMRAAELDFEKTVYNKIFEDFSHMKIDMAMKKYNNVHNRLRDLNYYILNSW